MLASGLRRSLLRATLLSASSAILMLMFASVSDQTSRDVAANKQPDLELQFGSGPETARGGEAPATVHSEVDLLDSGTGNSDPDYGLDIQDVWTFSGHVEDSRPCLSLRVTEQVWEHCFDSDEDSAVQIADSDFDIILGLVWDEITQVQVLYGNPEIELQLNLYPYRGGTAFWALVPASEDVDVWMLPLDPRVSLPLESG